MYHQPAFNSYNLIAIEFPRDYNEYSLMIYRFRLQFDSLLSFFSNKNLYKKEMFQKNVMAATLMQLEALKHAIENSSHDRKLVHICVCIPTELSRTFIDGLREYSGANIFPLTNYEPYFNAQIFRELDKHDFIELLTDIERQNINEYDLHFLDAVLDNNTDAIKFSDMVYFYNKFLYQKESK